MTPRKMSGSELLRRFIEGEERGYGGSQARADICAEVDRRLGPQIMITLKAPVIKAER